MPSPQGCFWLLTIPHHLFLPYLPDETVWIKGQLEQGEDTGYLHWQLVVKFKRSVRLRAVKQIFGDSVHAELTRSAAAESYVWKDETSVGGTRFELGEKSIKRGREFWENTLALAKDGRLDEIDPDVYIRYNAALHRIASYNMRPVPILREVYVFWGRTGLGKSRRAWEEAGMDAYDKGMCCFNMF